MNHPHTQLYFASNEFEEAGPCSGDFLAISDDQEVPTRESTPIDSDSLPKTPRHKKMFVMRNEQTDATLVVGYARDARDYVTSMASHCTGVELNSNDAAVDARHGDEAEALANVNGISDTDQVLDPHRRCLQVISKSMQEFEQKGFVTLPGRPTSTTGCTLPGHLQMMSPTSATGAVSSTHVWDDEIEARATAAGMDDNDQDLDEGRQALQDSCWGEG